MREDTSAIIQYNYTTVRNRDSTDAMGNFINYTQTEAYVFAPHRRERARKHARMHMTS